MGGCIQVYLDYLVLGLGLALHPDPDDVEPLDDLRKEAGMQER